MAAMKDVIDLTEDNIVSVEWITDARLILDNAHTSSSFRAKLPTLLAKLCTTNTKYSPQRFIAELTKMIDIDDTDRRQLAVHLRQSRSSGG